MKSDTLFPRIKQVLSETFELQPETIKLESNLYQDLDLDSLDAIDLAVKLHAETGIKLKEEELKSIRTVADIVNMVSQHVENGNSLKI